VTSTRAPFAYYGGKAVMADRIVSMLPPHRVYLEPFFGSGAVLFAKPKATIEVVNDARAELVTFFRVLRDCRPELEEKLRLTPYARDEFYAADLSEPGLPELEVARRFWVRVNQSFARTANHRRGWSITTGAHQSVSEGVVARLDRLDACAARLLTVGIENCDGIDLIERLGAEDAVIYADPTYLKSTRTSPNDYEDELTEEDHIRLLDVLRATPASVVLSGYPSELYADSLHDWHTIEVPVTLKSSNASRSENGARTEVLWTNFEPSLGRLPFGAMA
jgi:DNA adenine methylase